MKRSVPPAPHRLWGGRFGSPPADALHALNRSIATDFRLWPYDIQLSRVWTTALLEARVLNETEARSIEAGLDTVAQQLAAGATADASDEDVHTMIDRMLHAAVGDSASKLHTGRSRNDQVATATRLWAVDACAAIDDAVRGVQTAIADHAAQLGDAVMPAYTHMQRAQPVLASHWLLSHFWPLERDRARVAYALRAANDGLPLGSGAVAGTALPVSRERIRQSLHFSSLSRNSIDAVSDRDFVAELIFALALVATHLSRFAEDLILYGTSEFGFVRFGDAFSTGSSMMPQKRNPDAIEITRSSAARTLGNLVALLGTLKGLPTSYNKDLQDDKRALFDSVDSMALVLAAFTGAVAELTFDVNRMRAAVTSDMMATDLADYLVQRSVTFREAHRAVGTLVRQAEIRACELSELPESAFREAHAAFGPDAAAWLDCEHSLQRRDIVGGTGPTSVREQLEQALKALAASR